MCLIYRTGTVVTVNYIVGIAVVNMRAQNEYTNKLSDDERPSLRGGAFPPKQSPCRGRETASQKGPAVTAPDTFWLYSLKIT